MVIDLDAIADSAGEENEHACAFRVWVMLRMGNWRRAWRLATELRDFKTLAKLYEDYLIITGERMT